MNGTGAVVLPMARIACIAAAFCAAGSSDAGTWITRGSASMRSMQAASASFTVPVTAATAWPAPARVLKLAMATGARPSLPEVCPVLCSRSNCSARTACSVPGPNSPSMPPPR